MRGTHDIKNTIAPLQERPTEDIKRQIAPGLNTAEGIAIPDVREAEILFLDREELAADVELDVRELGGREGGGEDGGGGRRELKRGQRLAWRKESTLITRISIALSSPAAKNNTSTHFEPRNWHDQRGLYSKICP